MTDQPDGRLDLRALDAPPDAVRDEAVLGAVLARIAASDRAGTDQLAQLRAARRWMLAAAAVLIVIAGSAVATTLRQADGAHLDVISDWAQSNHVPTNGELLAAFHGYRP